MSQLADAWNRAKAHYASKSAPEPLAIRNS